MLKMKLTCDEVSQLQLLEVCLGAEEPDDVSGGEVFSVVFSGRELNKDTISHFKNRPFCGQN